MISPELRILVTGAAGQLGFELAAALAPLGTIIALDRAQLDIADADAIIGAMRRHAPDIVLNAAAYTAVDQAERESALAQAVNATAPGIFAEEVKRTGALLVHFSTDYVFNGTQRAPYAEDAATHPRNVYGETKLAGERAIAQVGATALILRTSWVYGRRGRNFLLTIRRLAQERDELRIVDDQHGTPNWSRTLARASAELVAMGTGALRERAGLYHLTSTGATTWCGFARAIVDDDALRETVSGARRRPRVVAIATSDYPTPAARPANSVLDGGKFTRSFGITLPCWEQALAECLAQKMPYPE
ncbi:MAG: dTDP-4-dehydrorhamnose reductase [Betaproteobacteria bacterium]